MNDKSFNFQDQIKMSEGVSNKKDIKEIILSRFPTAIQVEKATTSDDKSGTDYWVTIKSGQKLSIDVKVRKKDYSKDNPNKDDLALEVWSVINRRVGWTRDTEKRTDYILWIWLDTGRWMLIPFPVLCDIFVKNWEGWCKKYYAPIQETKNPNGSSWKSQCVFVPRKLIWTEYYTNFGGTPQREQRQVNTQVSLDQGIERAKQVKRYDPRVE